MERNANYPRMKFLVRTMKFGFSTNYFSIESLTSEFLMELKDINFGCIELFYPCLSDLPLKNELKKLSDWIRSYDYKISFHLPFMEKNSKKYWFELGKFSRIHYTVLKRGIELASLIEPEIIVIHDEPVLERTEEFNNLFLMLGKLAKFAAEFGLYISVETCWMDPLILRNGITKISQSENISLCMDFGHMNIYAYKVKKNLIGILEELKYNMAHIHVHDNHGETDEHLPLGRGIIDWKRIFQRLRANLNYKGFIIFETNPFSSINFLEQRNLIKNRNNTFTS